MIPVKQSKYAKIENGVFVERGNCYAAVIASILEIPLSDVPNVETLYEIPGYNTEKIMVDWLSNRSYSMEYEANEDLIPADELYFVIGDSPRGNCTHIVIYKNGQMVHDPHPSNDGILRKLSFKRLVKL